MLATIAAEEPLVWTPGPVVTPLSHLYFGHVRRHFQIRGRERAERNSSGLLLYRDSGEVHG